MTKPVKCACCDHYFIPRANNREKQKYCGSVDCQKARNRLKNNSFRKRNRADIKFRLSGAQRQRDIRKRRREAATANAAKGAAPPHVPRLEFDPQDVMLGLTAKFTGGDSLLRLPVWAFKNRIYSGRFLRQSGASARQGLGAGISRRWR